ncbi:fibronectin type III domain-containing protein [Pseudomonas baetica]|uniref:fibronectin type III domain-containing protein n=1 Tax=Pseudomonas baetica TaxID=674054 RepID=UPI003EEC040C
MAKGMCLYSRKFGTGILSGTTALLFSFFVAGLAGATSPENNSGEFIEEPDLDRVAASIKGAVNYDIPFDKVTRVTAHNAFLDPMQSQLARGVRGFMLDVYYTGPGAPRTLPLRLCHNTAIDYCGTNSKVFVDEMNNTFLPFLKSNPNEVITIHLETGVQREDLRRTFEKIPGIEKLVFNPDKFDTTKGWPTLREMIDSGQRIVLIVDSEPLKGKYIVNSGTAEQGTVYAMRDKEIETQNVYDLGANALNHNWSCATRWPAWTTEPQPAVPCKVEGVPKGCPVNGVPCEIEPEPKGCPIPYRPPQPIAEIPIDPAKVPSGFGNFQRLFIMNQFHAFIKSSADAGNIDNNLTYLERRVDSYCKSAAGRRVIPSEIAIDYTNVGDAIPYANALTYGGVYFYEKNNADTSGDTTCVLPAGQDWNLTLPSNGCENDEARSLRLRGIPKGTRITVYDSKTGNEDDFAIIDVTKDTDLIEGIVVGSFEQTSITPYYNIRSFRNNGIDGKVSRIKIEHNPPAFSEAAIVLKEGNNGSQNITCTVPLVAPTAFDMGGACDNDETRSGIITSAKAGTIITLYGDWGANKCDQGCLAIEVKRDITFSKTIPSYENSYEDDDVKVTRSGGAQQLDGKVSSIRVEFLPDAVPPSAPLLAPKPFGLSDTSATLSWSPASDNVGVTGYRVSVIGGSTDFVSGTSHTLTGLKSGTSYEVNVQAVDAAGNRSLPATIAFETPLAKPMNVALSFSGGIGQASLTPILDGRIYEWWVNGVKSDSAGALISFRFSEVPPGPLYTVRVRAIKGTLSSDFVEVSKESNNTHPSAPGDPVFSNVTDSSASVSWAPSSSDEPLAGYGLSFAGLPLGLIQQTSYSFTKLAPGTTYIFTVAAKNVSGNWSEVKAGSFKTLGDPPGAPPLPPIDLRVIETKTPGVVEFAWDKAEGQQVFAFKVMVEGKLAENVYLARSKIIEGLTVGEEYTFKVLGYDLYQRPSEPAEIKARIQLPGAPRNFKYAQRPGGLAQVDLSWDAPLGMDVKKYKLIFSGPGGNPLVKEVVGARKLLVLLYNDTTYTVTLTAHNDTDDSPPLIDELKTK